jgi:ATP-dependent helicase/nuclease subunit A
LQTKIIIEILKKFDSLYSHAKHIINGLDFADLEHYALELLTDEDSTQDRPIPSETALALRQRYKYIFVDEYQDINPVQKTILDTLVSAGGVFVVGDIKQSIYAFRGAKPEIFLSQLKHASPDPANAPTSLRVDLNTNFRSAKGILDFVNKLFSRIMTAPFTTIDYDESARLQPAPEHSSVTNNQLVVELHILDEEMAADEPVEPEDTTEEMDNSKKLSTIHYPLSTNLNIITSRQRQAAAIAQRVKQLVGTDTEKCEFQIFDKELGTLRNIEYRDICLLMRSPAERVNDYVEMLRLAGVPVSSEFGSGYFETTEITDILCLLKILDNPQQDIELAAVLRNPFFNISDTELAEIKLHSIGRHIVGFYNCVLQYCDNGPDAKLAEKLKKILAQVETWRTLGRRGSLADLIWKILRQTGFLSFVTALPNGQSRRANLLKLHDRAIQFENFAGSSGSVSLRRFVEFIEKLRTTATDWAKASPEAVAENAVRITSVHKSKGLEFPVVFLAELNSPFNKEDVFEDCIANDAALGLQIIDRKSNSKLSSIAHQVIAEDRLKNTLAEEMRILYVATTRAKERLILTACGKARHCRNIIRNGFYFGTGPIPDWQLRSCRSAFEWILYALSDQKILHEAFDEKLHAKRYTLYTKTDDLFSFKLYSQPELQNLSKYILKLKNGKSKRPAPATKTSRTKKVEPELLGRIKKSLSWRYPFSDVALLPAKRSVTQLTHHADEYADPSLVVRRSLLEPPQLTHHERRVTSRDIGTAAHLLISKLDLKKPITIEAIDQLKAQFISDHAIDKAVAEHIDTQSTMKFFESGPGRMVLDANNTVFREWPFTFALPVSFFTRDTSDERRDTIIIQGIIDMLIKTPDGLLVIDFKTDSITAKQAPQRAEFYREQLILYAEAASAILNSPILAKWLYFFTPRCAVEIKG